MQMSEAWEDQPRTKSGQFGRKPTTQAGTPDSHDVDLSAPNGQGAQPAVRDPGSRLLFEAISAAADREAMVEAGIQAIRPAIRNDEDRRDIALTVLTQLANSAEPGDNSEERQVADDLAEVLLFGTATEDLVDIWMPEQFERGRWKPLEHPSNLRWIEEDETDNLKRGIEAFPDKYIGELSQHRAAASLTDLKVAEAMRFRPRSSTAVTFRESGFAKSLRGHRGWAREINKHLDAANACALMFGAELCLHQDIERIAPARTAPSFGLYPEERSCGYCEGCYECSGSQPLARKAARLMENTMLRARHHCLAATRSFLESDWYWT